MINSKSAVLFFGLNDGTPYKQASNSEFLNSELELQKCKTDDSHQINGSPVA